MKKSLEKNKKRKLGKVLINNEKPNKLFIEIA